MASQSYLASLANSAAANRLTVISDFIGVGSRVIPAVGAAVTANQVYNAMKDPTSISDLYQNVMSPFVDISQTAQNGVQAVSSYLDKFGNWLNDTASSVTPSIPAPVPYPATTPKASIPTPARQTAPISPVTPAKSPVTNYPSALKDGASLIDVIAQNGKILQGGISGEVGVISALASIAAVLGSGVQVQYDALSGIGASLASLIPPLQLIAPAIENAVSPTITVPTPTVNVAAPSVTVQPPSVTIENKAPAITVPTPEVSITNQVSTPTIENSIDFTPVIGALGSIADSLPDVS